MENVATNQPRASALQRHFFLLAGAAFAVGFGAIFVATRMRSEPRPIVAVVHSGDTSPAARVADAIRYQYRDRPSLHSLMAGEVPLNSFIKTDGLTIAMTPLMLAVEYSNVQAVFELLLLRPDLDQKNEHGNTALMMAAGFPFEHKTQAAIVRMLLSQKANPNITNHQGLTALDLARLEKNAEAEEALIAGGASR